MIKKEDIIPLISIVTIASIWGYFIDLQNGEVGWFVGRIFFFLLCFFYGKYYKTINRKK